MEQGCLAWWNQIPRYFGEDFSIDIFYLIPDEQGMYPEKRITSLMCCQPATNQTDPNLRIYLNLETGVEILTNQLSLTFCTF